MNSRVKVKTCKENSKYIIFYEIKYIKIIFSICECGVWAGTHANACAHEHKQKPEEGVKCPALSSPLYSIKTGYTGWFCVST